MYWKNNKDNLLHSPISKEVELLIKELEQVNMEHYIKYTNKDSDDDCNAVGALV